MKIILLLCLIACQKSEHKIHYDLKKSDHEFNQDCPISFSTARQNMDKFQYKPVGKVHIPKEFFHQIPAGAEEIQKLFKEITPTLCRHGVNYAEMLFKDNYLAELSVFYRLPR